MAKYEELLLKLPIKNLLVKISGINKYRTGVLRLLAGRVPIRKARSITKKCFPDTSSEGKPLEV